MSRLITPGTSDVFAALDATLPIFIVVGIASLIVAYIVRRRQKHQDEIGRGFKHMTSSKRRTKQKENGALQ